MVLPVQQVVGIRGDADAELGFGLSGRSSDVDWIMPAEVQQMLDRSPGVQARLRGLPVGNFLLAEVERVGDPLYGQLLRLAALVDAEAVFLPILAIAEAEGGGDPTVRLTSTLINARTGRVLWFGIVEGGAYPAGDPRGLASVVDVLARTLLWYVPG